MIVAQRETEYRSRKYLDGARGSNCKLRFVGVCNHNPETVVACHIHDGAFGLARKAHDFSTIDGCSACHMFLDHGWVGKISNTIRLQHIIRGLQETLLDRVVRGIVFVQLDIEKPRRDRPVNPRKAIADRKPIPAGRPLESRSEFAPGRKMVSRNNLRRPIQEEPLV